MDAVLNRIKNLVRRGRYILSEKARLELAVDNLTDGDAAESILNADRIEKTLRSTSPRRRQRRDLLYVIHAPTNHGVWLYTKGLIRGEGETAVYYLLVSAKLLQ